jgi:membrane protein DedA with SNARE-associated domain
VNALIASWFAHLCSWGYGGVFVLMAIESTVFPLPSELVVPPAAWCVLHGHMSFAGLVAASTLGSWAGSALSYGVARAAGRPLILRYGRYVLVPETKWLLAERWIRHFAAGGVFFARLLPVVRHLVSLPAGAARMPFRTFTLMTLLGSLLWSTVLAWFGQQVLAGQEQLLSDPRGLAHVLKHKLLWFVAAAAVLLVLYVVVDVIRRRQARIPVESEG